MERLDGTNRKTTESTDLEKYAGAYGDIARLLGEGAAEALHREMAGQQVTFPRRLYTREYVVSRTEGIADQRELKKAAVRYGYTERRLRQLLAEHKARETGG